MSTQLRRDFDVEYAFLCTLVFVANTLTTRQENQEVEICQKSHFLFNEHRDFM